MIKADIVNEVVRKTNLKKKQAKVVVDSFFSIIADALSKGEGAEIRGFGSFKARNRNAREGRNPISGEKLNIPSKRYPHFRAAKALKAIVDKSYKNSNVEKTTSSI